MSNGWVAGALAITSGGMLITMLTLIVTFPSKRRTRD